VNEKQRLYLWVGIVVVVLMGIFPPTQRGYCPAMTFYEGVVRRRGEPLRPIGYTPAHYGYTFLLSAKASDIAFNKLIIQWGIVGAVTFGLIYIFRDKKPKKQNFCLWAGIVVIVLMGIFPPARPGIPPRPLVGGKPVHYIFLLSAKASDIAFKKLIIRWGIVGAVTFGLFYIFRDKNPKGQQKELRYPEE
jgi:multisubunit Na+/H+ antiporter MnhB subunit